MKEIDFCFYSNDSRREGDSNPWYDYSYASLAMKYFRPLSHPSTPSVARCSVRDKTLLSCISYRHGTLLFHALQDSNLRHQVLETCVLPTELRTHKTLQLYFEQVLLLRWFGVTGFEPATTSSQRTYATKLRYTPICSIRKSTKTLSVKQLTFFI